jgi:hypothetical protein
MLYTPRFLDLLAAPLTMPLVGCHSKRCRRTARCGEAMARRQQEDTWAGLATRGMGSDGVVPPPVWSHRGVAARSVVPEWCHASGAAVDLCSVAPACAPRAGCAADGSVVDVSRALSGSPRAPRITAQRSAQSDPYNSHNCLLPKKLHREIQ